MNKAMSGKDLLDMVEVLAHEKSVDIDVVFGRWWKWLSPRQSSARLFPGEDADVVVHIDRETGDYSLSAAG